MAEVVTKERVKELEVFKGLSDKDCDRIANVCTEETYEKDDILFNQGDYGRKVYVIESGRLVCESEVVKDKRIIVGQEKTGGLCGWSGAIEPYIYTARGRATEKTTVFVINAEQLQELCNLHNNICVVFNDFLLNTVVKRLDDLRKYVAEVLHYSQGYMD